MELTPFFDEYLRHAATPTLEWRFDEVSKQVSYRWKADEPGFAMPIEAGDPQHWTRIVPATGTWKTLPWNGTADSFQVPTDRYYVTVERLQQ